MDDEAEIELPSEHRIVRFDDGDHCIFKVYLKDGKPWQYDDGDLVFGCRLAPSREGLETALMEMGAAVAQAISLPTLSEEDDFPGQNRPTRSAHRDWLKHVLNPAD